MAEAPQIFIEDVTNEFGAADDAISHQVLWSKPRLAGSAPSPRGGHTATFVNDRIYIIGGVTPKAPVTCKP